MPTRRAGRRASLARRGRLAILSGLVAFICGQIGFTFVLERWKPQLRDPEFGYRLVRLRNLLAKAPKRPLVLVLGSSRPGTGFRPDALPPLKAANGTSPVVFNFSQTGAGPLTELLCLRRLLSLGIRPNYVLVEVFGPVLHADGVLAEEHRFRQNHGSYWSDLSRLYRYTENRRQLCKLWIKDHLVPVYANRNRLQARFLGNWQEEQSLARRELLYWQSMIHPLGWQAHPDVTPAVYRQGLERTQKEFIPYFSQYHISRISDGALRELVQLCQSEQISVALFLMPEASEYRNWYAASAGRQLRNYVDGLSREFRIPWIDAQDWLTDDGFADGQHLLPAGAAAFTECLGRELLQSLLLGQSLPGKARTFTSAQDRPSKADISVIRTRIDPETRKANLTVRLVNTGETTWIQRPGLRGTVTLALFQGQLGCTDFREAPDRNHLLEPVSPGKEIQLQATFTLPEEFDQRPWRLDLVSEGCYWFSTQGTVPAEVRLEK